MLIIWPALAIAIVQGLAEFLPVSSSAHTTVVAALVHLPAAEAHMIDAAANCGTLAAILVYFRAIAISLVQNIPQSFRALGRRQPDWGLGLVLATVLAMLLGGMIKFLVGPVSQNWATIGAMSLVFGVILFIADRMPQRRFDPNQPPSYFNMMWLGCAEGLSVLPGVSRSGITLTAARIFQMERWAAYELSFVLAIPVTVAAIILNLLSGFAKGASLSLNSFFIPAIVSFCLGIMMLLLMKVWLKRHTFQFFALYRIVFGGIMLVVFFAFRS